MSKFPVSAPYRHLPTNARSQDQVLRRIPRLMLVALVGAVLAACSTVTPYAPARKADSLGYSETRIESNRFRVIFRFGSDVRPERAEALLLRRAAEVMLANGFDWFRVVDQQAERDPRPTGGSTSIGIGGGSVGGRAGGGVGIGFDLTPEQYRSTGRLEVLGGTGAKPDDPRVYDARNVLDTTKAALNSK